VDISWSKDDHWVTAQLDAGKHRDDLLFTGHHSQMTAIAGTRRLRFAVAQAFFQNSAVAFLAQLSVRGVRTSQN
jgi:hypothetical protein